MKSGKFLFLAIIFLVSLLCISAVSAADEAVSDVIADTNDETVLQESIDDATLADSPNDEQVLEESYENFLSDDGEEWSQPSPNPPIVSTFSELNDEINNGKDVVYLDADSYEYWEDDDVSGELIYGIVIDRPVTIYGNGHTIDGRNQARIFWISCPNVEIHDINFINGYSGGLGGAICGFADSECTVINCNFTNNHADDNGGAIYEVSAINCNFTGNNADDFGGAIWRGTATNSNFIGNYASGNGGAIYEGTAINCNFTQNRAENDGGALGFGTASNCDFNENSAYYGGALSDGDVSNCTFTQNIAYIAGGAIYGGTATNCTFKENQASDSGGAIYGGTATNCNFTGNHAENGGAMCFGTASNCDFNENSAYYGGSVSNGDVSNCTFTANYAEYGGALYQSNAVNSIFTENYGVGNCVGGAIYNGSAINCTFTSNYAQYRGGAIYIGSAVNCIFNGNTANYGGAICGNMETGELSTADSCIFNGDTCYLVTFYQPVLNAFNFVSTYKDDSKLVVNITSSDGMPIANANIKVDVKTSTGAFVGTYNIKSGGWVVPLNAGSYIVTYNATDFDIPTVEGMIVVNKDKTTVSSKAVTAIYNNNKYLVATLKDSKGRIIRGVKVTVKVGTISKTLTTDKNGQIKVNVGKLVPKSYTAKISFAGNTNYLASSTTAKVTVKKATPKMTAKAKTFKVGVKTKKYTITLKNNLNKVMKSTKVTLTVNKKTYTVKTNSKGVATFKITNLKKRGKFTATIKYAGSKYYKALSKKVKITVKK